MAQLDVGSLTNVQGCLSFRSNECSWQVEMADIVLVGECTDGGAAPGDDWLLVIIDGKGKMVVCPANADGCADALGSLSRLMEAPLFLALCGSTDHCSRVLYPPPLTEHPLFEFRHDREHLPWYVTMRNWCLGVPPVSVCLTDEVKSTLSMKD